MGKKRFTRINNSKEETLDVIRIIEKDNGETFFEIQDVITQDAAEAVAIMMRITNFDPSIWSIQITVDLDNISPRKCLYYLTGGDKEWIKLTNYSKPWVYCDDIFENEFEFVIRWILKKSKNLKEIRDSFREHLNLPTLYEFALSKNLIK